MQSLLDRHNARIHVVDHLPYWEEIARELRPGTDPELRLSFDFDDGALRMQLCYQAVVPLRDLADDRVMHALYRMLGRRHPDDVEFVEPVPSYVDPHQVVLR